MFFFPWWSKNGSRHEDDVDQDNLIPITFIQGLCVSSINSKTYLDLASFVLGDGCWCLPKRRNQDGVRRYVRTSIVDVRASCYK